MTGAAIQTVTGGLGGVLLGLLCLAAPAPAPAPRPEPAPLVFPPERGEVLVLPVAAVDGDTIDFYFLVPSRGRVNGINAPELHSKDPAEKAAGIASRDYLAGRLPAKPTPATLFGREKYGRILIDLADVDGGSLARGILAAGHAAPWDGRGPRP